MSKLRAGIIGCGIICRNYLRFSLNVYPQLEIAACADIVPGKAEELAQEFPALRPMSVAEMMADKSIDMVLNFTIPAAHFDIAMQALNAGKHVYSEKPIVISRHEAEVLCRTAGEKGLRLGCAPDTFLGGGIQSVIKLINDGAVGRVIAISGNMLFHGPESFHPNSEFYYQPGGGPLFDMAPYYLNAFIAMLGPVKAVSCHAVKGFETRHFGCGPKIPDAKKGKPIPVEVYTHWNTILEFANGTLGNFNASWDVWGSEMPKIEIHGTTGSIVFTDPNSFTGKIRLFRESSGEWEDVPLTHNDDCGRGIGIADMAQGIIDNRPHRASGEMALHVFDIMQSALESAESGRSVTLTTTCDRPAPLMPGSKKEKSN